MGIEISKYSQEQQVSLNALDTNKDGMIDKADGYTDGQISAFESMLATKENDIKPGDTFTTNPAATTGVSKSVTEGMTEKEAKKWNKETKEAHIDELKYAAKNGQTRAEFLAAIEEQGNKNPEFNKAVKDVNALMQESYFSTKGVDASHKEIEKKLEAAGLKDDLHKDILKQLEAMAKNEALAEAMADVAAAYKEISEKNPTMTSQQVMNELKKEAKSKSLFNGDFKKAFKNFSEPARKAYMNVMNVISEIDDIKFSKNGKKVQNEAKRILKERGQWDKYANQALYGNRNIFKRLNNWAKGYKNDARLASDVQARKNNVQKHNIQSHKEVAKAMGRKMDKFVKLYEAGIVTKDENGNWDLSELSKIIGNQIGSDYKLNREHKKDKEVAEIANVQSKLEAIQGLGELSESEAKALIKLCGFDIEGKNIGRAILGGVVGAVSGAAYGAAVGLGAAKAAESSLPKSYYFGGGEYDIPPMHIENNLDLSQVNNQKLPEGVSIDASGNIVIDIAGMIKEGVYLVDCVELLDEMAIRTAVCAALPTALVGAAIGALRGLEDKGQTPVLSVGFEEETYKDYCKMLESGPNKKYAPIGKLIAGSFIDKDGNWDREGYKDFLNHAAGNQNTLLNREELIGALLERQAELKNNASESETTPGTTPETNPETTPETTPGTNPVKKCSVEVEKQEDTVIPAQDKTMIHYRKDNPGVGWKEIVEAYYPCLVENHGGKLYGPDGAIRAFQKALCTDENGNLDKAKLHNLIRGYDIPKEIKLPLKVEDCDRDDNAKPQKGNYKPETPIGNRPMSQVGRNAMTVEQRTPGLAIATDGCDGTKASGATPEEAVKNLKKTTGKKYENESEYIK